MVYESKKTLNKPFYLFFKTCFLPTPHRRFIFFLFFSVVFLKTRIKDIDFSFLIITNNN